jgi:hypothetical protein
MQSSVISSMATVNTRTNRKYLASTGPFKRLSISTESLTFSPHIKRRKKKKNPNEKMADQFYDNSIVVGDN